MTPQQIRSTDNPFRPSPLKVMLTAEDARAAVTNFWHCGWCGATGPDLDRGHGLRTHKCVDASGRDLDLVKKMHAEGARRELKALRNYPCPPCICGKVFPPGSSHDCPGPDRGPMPHETMAQAAGAAQRRAELEAQLRELGVVPTKEESPHAG